MKRIIVFLLPVVLLLLYGCKKDSINPRHTGELYLDHSTDIAVALQGIESQGDHLWQKAQWWNSANIMEAMIDYSKNSGADLSGMCSQIYNANQYHAGGGFKNSSYDDCAWWALAWVKAYDLYGDTRYLETAEDIFAYIAVGGWDNICNGGMNWQNTHRYKNAVSNELFCLLAGRLAERQTEVVQKAYYLDWAIKDWNWLQQSGMINTNNLFNDGLDNNCNNNGGITWTYNQGVILAGLKELYVLTSEQQYLQIAHRMALASMCQLSDADTVLTEPTGRYLSDDGAQFKGPYIKFLAELNTVLKDTVIKLYIVHNAAVAWTNAQNNQHLFDCYWQGPFESWRGSSTGVALDLMNAATIENRQ